jgi:hypothetical protein
MTIPGTPPAREPETWYRGKMRPRSEVERIKREEAAAQMAGPVVVDSPTPAAAPGEAGPGQRDGDEAGAGPVETVRGEHDPAPEETPAPVTPPRIRSSVPPTLIGIDGIALDIANDRGMWYVGIYRAGEKVADDASRSNPLITKGTAKRIADRVKKEFDHLDRKAVQKAVDTFFEAVREADETITADAVCRVISAIERVEKETSDPPAYVVHLTGGKCLEFSTRDLAALQPVTLNERWLAVRDDPLDATGRDFKEIRDHLLAVAVPVDPPGPASPWEWSLSKLETELATIPLEADRVALRRYGICLEPNGILLVRSDIIVDVLVKTGQNPHDGGFSRYLKREGILLVESKPYRIPGVKTQVRAWGLTPDIREEPTEGLEGSLSEDPVGD